MSASLCTLALVAAIGQYPGCSSCASGYAGGYGGMIGAYGGMDMMGYGLSGEMRYPFDQTDPWLHGYFQEMPAYGGYGRFRPYNYKHVFSHAQVAAMWGMPYSQPYSQDYFHRLRPPAAVGWRSGSQYSSLSERTILPDARGALGNPPVVVLDSRPQGPILTNPGGVLGAPTARDIDPAAFSKSAPAGDLQEQIRQQNAQLQALRQALLDEYAKNAGR